LFRPHEREGKLKEVGVTGEEEKGVFCVGCGQRI